MTVVILFFTFSMMATKLKATKSNIIHDIVKGVPVENEANSNEEMMPLPYCKAPMNAAAEPTIVAGTASSAAALVHDAIMPFMLKMMNTKPMMPNMPPQPVEADRKRPMPPMMAVEVENSRSLSSE